MSIEVRPLGVACNIRCKYCYQNPQRDAGGSTRHYDLALIKSMIAKRNRAFTLFGGEPLLLPIEDLEELWSWGFEKFKKNSLQTNGTLITDRHIDLFKKYNVGVGISIDGPDELNDVRWAGSPEATRRATTKTEAAIRKLISEKIEPGLIITLHRLNAAPAKLQRLTEWIGQLDEIGVRSVRLHILEVENVKIRQLYTLTDEENIGAFVYLWRAQKQFKRLRFDVFREMKALLRGEDDSGTCIWHACDPYTTEAVQGIEGLGQQSNCGRTNKDGVDYVKADRAGFERYLALYRTDQKEGGCRDCRYFLMCKGQCPGTAINGDWRNRSEHCGVWKKLFSIMEAQALKKGDSSLINDGERRQMEQQLIAAWKMGQNPRISELLARIRQPETSEAVV